MGQVSRAIMVSAAVMLLASPVGAQGAKPLTKCASDAVVAGTVCMDKFEASVWRVALPTTANKGLVKKIQQGKATVADLAKGSATQLGTASDDYAPCADSGQNCTDDIYAVSLPGVSPSAFITWFQAQAACKNARKRLPSNAEWQAAVIGTPNPGLDNGTSDCNTASTLAVVPTGSRGGCMSADGTFDMVGNLDEWVAVSGVRPLVSVSAPGSFLVFIFCLPAREEILQPVGSNPTRTLQPASQPAMRS